MIKGVFTVSQINNYIKNLFDKDVLLNDVFIEAEISNFKIHSTGHFYFTLKDNKSSINAVMYKSYSQKVIFTPENGMKVRVYGYISSYEKTGNYSIYVNVIEPFGKGVVYTAYEQLKERLYKEGLFDEKHKRSIPKYPKCVAVITSDTGAAIRDIINVSKRRNSNVKIVIYPVLVQGENSADEIKNAFQIVNKWGKADTIILARGGGSIEDLYSFNDEEVARAIYKSKIPVISAVGHETDFTISDFVSDFRAPTPSVAAEIAVNDINLTFNSLNDKFKKLNDTMDRKIYENKMRFEININKPVLKNLLNNIYNMQIYLYELNKKLYREMKFKIDKNKMLLNNIINNFENISPVNIIKKGYCLVYDKNDNIINSINNVEINDKIKLSLSDGFIKCSVTTKGELYGKEKDI